MRRPILVGCLLLACSTERTKEPESRERVGVVRSALSTALSLEFPAGLPPESYALAASSSLRVNDRAVVTGASANTGTGGMIVGADAKVGTLLSASSVTLRERARVDGQVRSGGAVTSQPGAVVTGAVVPNDVVPKLTRQLLVDFGNAAGGSVQPAAGQNVQLAPGSYDAVRVGPNAAVQLAPGRYYVRTLVLDTSSQLRLGGNGDPIYFFVRDSVLMRGKVVRVGSIRPGFLLAYAGTAGVFLESGFDGAFVASNAKVSVQGGSPYRGQLVAKEVELHQGLQWDLAPFAFWQRVLEPSGYQEPSTLPGESLEQLLPNNPLGSAVRAYVTASFAGTSASNRQSALNHLKTFPVADVLAALSYAFTSSNDASLRFAMVATAEGLNHPQALSYFSSILTAPLDERILSSPHGSYMTHARVLTRAVSGVERLMIAGVSGADSVLLAAASTHKGRFVRSTAIQAITRSGSASLKASLNASIANGDRIFLTLRPMTRADGDEVVRTLTQKPSAPDAVDPIAPPGDSSSNSPIEPSRGGTSGQGGAGGGGNSGGGGTGGSGSGGACTVATAVDLGGDGHSVTVRNDGCVRVRDSYPSWWQARNMKLETTLGGSYAVPFVWSNSCSGVNGSSSFTADWQVKSLGTISSACATLIDLQGSGNGNVTLRYWAQ
jgi:uncharacterized membrane protein YgcG